MIKEKSFLQPFIFAVGYACCFYLLQFFFSKTGMLLTVPSATNIKHWDVGYYDSVAHGGYDKDSNNTGFCILFPLIWRWSHLGIWGISLVNILFFSAGFALLIRESGIRDKMIWLLCLSLPPVYFAFIPYTESLFFLFGAIILYGIRNQKFWLTWFALLVVALLRVTTIFFIPALFLVELFSNPARSWWRSTLTFLYKYALPCLLGLSIFILWQYLETGIWFALFKKQATVWQHTFTIPEFPFKNIENGNIRYHWLSAIALFIGFMAFVLLVRQLISWLKNKTTQQPELVFSLGYLVMALFCVITFSPKYGGHATNVMGANRYMMATAFCFHFLLYLTTKSLSIKDIVLCGLTCLVFVQFFDAYDNPDNFLRTGLMPVVLSVGFLVFCRDHRKFQWIAAALIAFNLFAQMHLFQQFIADIFVD